MGQQCHTQHVLHPCGNHIYRSRALRTSRAERQKTPSSDRRPKEKIFQSGTHQPQLPHTQIYLLPANAQQLSGTERTRDRGFRRFDHSTCRSRQGCGRRHQPEPSLRHLLFHGHRQICRSNAAAQTISRREYRTPQKIQPPQILPNARRGRRSHRRQHHTARHRKATQQDARTAAQIKERGMLPRVERAIRGRQT